MASPKATKHRLAADLYPNSEAYSSEVHRGMKRTFMLHWNRRTVIDRSRERWPEALPTIRPIRTDGKSLMWCREQTASQRDSEPLALGKPKRWTIKRTPKRISI